MYRDTLLQLECIMAYNSLTGQACIYLMTKNLPQNYITPLASAESINVSSSAFK